MESHQLVTAAHAPMGDSPTIHLRQIPSHGLAFLNILETVTPVPHLGQGDNHLAAGQWKDGSESSSPSRRSSRDPGRADMGRYPAPCRERSELGISTRSP